MTRGAVRPGSSKSICPMSSLGSAVLQSGARSMGVGLGAGVGGLAGAEGKVLPGMTLGLVGMGMGMVGTPGREEEEVEEVEEDEEEAEEEGVLMGRTGCAARALPLPA